MVRILCFALFAIPGIAATAETAHFSFAEAFTAGDGQALEVSYRVYTAPMLTELQASGILVERLETWPAEIHLKVGATLSLRDLQITAFGPDGNIQERAPLTLNLQGPAELFDFEDFITYGNDILAVRAGQAKIWIKSVMPSSTGDYAEASIELVVRGRGIDSEHEP